MLVVNANFMVHTNNLKKLEISANAHETRESL